MNPYIQYMYSYPHKTAYGPLEGVRFEDYAHGLKSGENSLYFHIPFCESKCGYCNLFSVTGQSEAFMAQYVDAMERQAVQWSAALPDDVEFADLTLGGGTPLLLPERELERVFRIAGEWLGFEGLGKHTVVETSPAQATEEKLHLLKEHHVTRVSIGVQSFHEEELRTIHRSHTAEQAERALDRIRRVGFLCVNVDMIYGIPGQTEESLLQSAERALAFEPEELFVYPLYIKKGTYLFHSGAVRSEHTYEMYLRLRDYLRENGYVAESMRRFVRRGSGDEAFGSIAHEGGNLAQNAGCGFGNTLSFGCGGRSYIGNLHFCTPYAVRQSQCRELLQRYIAREDFMEIRHGFLLSEDEQKRRYVIKNILFWSGLSEREYREAFDGDLTEDFPILAEWIRQGCARERDGVIVLTDEGLSLSDYLGPMLMSEAVRDRMRRSEVSPLSEGDRK